MGQPRSIFGGTSRAFDRVHSSLAGGLGGGPLLKSLDASLPPPAANETRCRAPPVALSSQRLLCQQPAASCQLPAASTCSAPLRLFASCHPAASVIVCVWPQDCNTYTERATDGILSRHHHQVKLVATSSYSGEFSSIFLVQACTNSTSCDAAIALASRRTHMPPTE